MQSTGYNIQRRALPCLSPHSCRHRCPSRRQTPPSPPPYSLTISAPTFHSAPLGRASFKPGASRPRINCDWMQRASGLRLSLSAVIGRSSFRARVPARCLSTLPPHLQTLPEYKVSLPFLLLRACCLLLAVCCLLSSVCCLLPVSTV
jgi:hypothetical protein